MRLTRPVRLMLLLAILAALALGLAAAASATPKPADTVFTQGYVYTVNGAHPTAHAVAVRGGKITYIGSNRGARAFVGAHTKVVDLKGKMLLPSFSDAHAHVQSAVTFLYAANLYGLTSLPEYLTAIQQFATANPTMASIQGNGWSEALFPGIGPLKTALDAVVSDRPVALWSDGHHSIWANSKALEMAHITGNTPDPVGGVIERVPARSASRARRMASRPARCARNQPPTWSSPPSPTSRSSSMPTACASTSRRSPARSASRSSTTRCSTPAPTPSPPTRSWRAPEGSPCA